MNGFLGVGGGGAIGFADDGRFFLRIRVGKGFQIGASIVQTPIPSQLDERLPDGFATFPFAFFAEASAQVKIPRTPLAFDLSLFSLETGLAKPPTPGSTPFLELRPVPQIDGGTVGGFDVGASAGIEFLFLGGGPQ